MIYLEKKKKDSFNLYFYLSLSLYLNWSSTKPASKVLQTNVKEKKAFLPLTFQGSAGASAPASTPRGCHTSS